MGQRISLEPILEHARRLHRQGDLAGAADLCRRILMEDRRHVGAQLELGLVQVHAGEPAKALASFERVLARAPRMAEAFHGQAMAYTALGQRDKAVAALRRVLALQPGLVGARNSLGLLLGELGEHAEAEGCFRDCIGRMPSFPEGHLGLVLLLQKQGRLDEALAAIQACLELLPEYVEGHFEAGHLFGQLKRYDEAVVALERALTLRPNYLEAHYNLAMMRSQLGRLEEAVDSYETCVRLNPQLAPVLNNLGTVLLNLGRVEEALDCYRRALAIEDVPPLRSNLLLTLHYLPGIEPAEVYQEHCRWDADFAAKLGGGDALIGSAGDRESAAPCASEQPARLRVGYVSADLREHSVGRMMLPLLENHDPRQVEVFVYMLSPLQDEWTQRLRRPVSVWRDVHQLSEAAIAEQVRADRIDILVDLGGHTAHSRLLIFAHRPAPVQVSYLGYPDTTGMQAMDFRMVDSHSDPPGQSEPFTRERLVRLDPCAWCYPPLEEVPVTPRGEQPVTFGCFNSVAKINPPLLRLWARILAAVPDSRLLLKAPGWSGPRARRLLEDIFAGQGVDGSRIELLGRIDDYCEHLTTHLRMDIALDTFPYHGTNMTCEALWMGIPVITMAGNTHVSRVGVSLLNNVGHPEWVAVDADDYVGKAVALASDPGRLAMARASLRAAMRASALMDGASLARRIEAAYLSMCGAR